MSNAANDNYEDMYLPTTSGSESKTLEHITNWTVYANLMKNADTSQQEFDFFGKTEVLLNVSMSLGMSRSSTIPLAPSTTINNAYRDIQEYMKSLEPVCGLPNECAKTPTLVDGRASFQESTKNQGPVSGQKIVRYVMGNVRQDNLELPPLLPRRTDGHMNVVIRNGVSLRSSEETGEANDHDVKDEVA